MVGVVRTVSVLPPGTTYVSSVVPCPIATPFIVIS